MKMQYNFNHTDYTLIFSKITKFPIDSQFTIHWCENKYQFNPNKCNEYLFGWICPKCGKINAPYNQTCLCKKSSFFKRLFSKERYLNFTQIVLRIYDQKLKQILFEINFLYPSGKMDPNDIMYLLFGNLWKSFQPKMTGNEFDTTEIIFQKLPGKTGEYYIKYGYDYNDVQQKKNVFLSFGKSNNQIKINEIKLFFPNRRTIEDLFQHFYRMLL